MGPSAPRKSRSAALKGLTHTNAHHCILLCMSSMHTKFQLSISINKKLMKRGRAGGALVPPTKSRFAVHRRVNLHVYIYFYSIYAYQISDFHLNYKKRGAFGPMPGRFPTLGGLVHTYAYHCIPFCMNIMHTKFQTSILLNKKKSLKMGGFIIG